jgi:dUTP pyrophosphatase
MDNTHEEPVAVTSTNASPDIQYVYVIDGYVNIPVTLETGAILPEYKTPGSAGMDLCANEDAKLFPFVPTLVRTGLRMAIPAGFEGQVRPRSGLALKGITVVNTPGTIDSDYRGEIGVILMFLHHGGPEPYKIVMGDRIAQLVIHKVQHAQFDARLFLDDTERGEGGFGHTGV